MATTHRAMILCGGAVDSHQKQRSKSIAQWEHLFFAIFAIFALKRQLTLLEMACDQWISMILYHFSYVLVYNTTIFDDKIIAQWEHHTHAMRFNEGIQCH